MLKEYQERLLELLEQLELNMADLYKLFAVKFPKHADLWVVLSQQELEHAKAVKRLSVMAKDNKVVFEEKLTRTYTVKKVLEIVRDTYAQVQANKINLMTALSISRDFEQSILEKEFYNYFIGKDSDTRALIDQIKGETFDHQAKVRNVWEEERKIVLGTPRKL